MSSTDEIIRSIEELRQLMYQSMNKKTILTDTELVALSQKLDELLNEYNKLTSRKA